jgi:hypothetical protein
MTTPCTEHLPYVGAIADEEWELVPAEQRWHVAECPACAAELATQRRMTERLRAARAHSARSAWCSRVAPLAGWPVGWNEL